MNRHVRSFEDMAQRDYPDEDCGELSRAELRAGRVSWDYMSGDDGRAKAFVAAQEEHLRAYGIDDQVLVVDDNFWRGLKVALGFTIVMASLLAVVGYRLFS